MSVVSLDTYSYLWHLLEAVVLPHLVLNVLLLSLCTSAATIKRRDSINIIASPELISIIHCGMDL